MGGSFDPGAVAQDKDFLAASYPEKIKYLASQDQDFASATPQDQVGYVNHLLGKPAPNFATRTDTSRAKQSDSTLAQAGRMIPSAVGAGLRDVGGMLKSAPRAILNTAFPENQILPETLRSKLGLPPAPPEQAQQMSADWQRRKQEGYGLPYRVGAPIAEAVGANVTGMEQAAKKGDVGGVLGHAAVPMVMAAAPLGIEGAGRVANRILPSTTRAGAGLNMLTDSPDAAFAQHPAETPNAHTTARKIQSELEVTGEKPHAIIQHYIEGQELRHMPPEIVDQARALGIDPAQGMTMYEARTMLKRVNNIIDASKGFAADAASKTAITNLKRFAGALDEDISANAGRMGFGADYEAMRNEYRHGKQIIRAGEDIGAPAGALAGYEVGRMAGEPVGGTLLGGVIGKKIGKYTTGAVARGVVERNAGPPRLRSLPPSPEAHLRTVLDAKEGLISPGEADRRITRNGGRVKVKPIPQPTE